jgi:hypothetical protein
VSAVEEVEEEEKSFLTAKQVILEQLRVRRVLGTI